MLVLNSHNWLSLNSPNTSVLVIVSIEESSESLQVVLILLLDLSEGNTGGGLLVDNLTESGLSLNEAVWDFHLSAEGWEMNHQLNRDDIMGDSNKLGSLVLNKSGYVAETELSNDWLGSLLGFLTVSLSLGLFLESLSLLDLGLWGVLGEEGEELVGLVSLEGVGELVDGSWDGKSLEENLLLSREG